MIFTIANTVQYEYRGARINKTPKTICEMTTVDYPKTSCDRYPRIRDGARIKQTQKLLIIVTAEASLIRTLSLTHYSTDERELTKPKNYMRDDYRGLP